MSKLTPETSAAQRARNIRWYAKPENRAKAIAKSVARYARLKNDPEFRARSAARKRAWISQNPEKASAITKRRREKHRDKLNAARRQYTLENPGVNTAQIRKHRGLPSPTRPMPDVCENCGGPPTGRGSLHLDHDHVTKVFRGWLCSKCNSGLGLLGDNNFGLQRASMYLMRAECA